MLSVAAIAVRGIQVSLKKALAPIDFRHSPYVQLLCSIVVLGLSVTAAKQQVFSSVPTETSFSSFAGGFGIIVSAIGLASIWLHKIPPTVVMGIDALASVFFLAGGIVSTSFLAPV